MEHGGAFFFIFFFLGGGVEKPHGKMLQYAPCREDLRTFDYTSKTNVGRYASPNEHFSLRLVY